ncbi:hypothetical protein KIL84_020433 [Mauremys mutica]|uniref:Uncharacterized protein n=1 Tax=Mauremys mutica TaxID=74926 RepID=A0A9D3XVM7_9SAUR|nr:hypothetical protein KIL84_020433 [Mauremys mutica]
MRDMGGYSTLPPGRTLKNGDNFPFPCCESCRSQCLARAGSSGGPALLAYRALLSFQRGVARNSLACGIGRELQPLPALGQQFKPSLGWELADGCYHLMPYSASYEINSALVLGLGHNNHPKKSGANLVLFPLVGRLVVPLGYGWGT